MRHYEQISLFLTAEYLQKTRTTMAVVLRKIRVFLCVAREGVLPDDVIYCATQLGLRMAEERVTALFYTTSPSTEETARCLEIEKIEGGTTTRHFLYYHDPRPEDLNSEMIWQMFEEMETISQSTYGWAVFPLSLIEMIAKPVNYELPAGFSELSSITVELLNNGSLQISGCDLFNCPAILANRPQADGNN
jgi:hypothetical protein